LIYHGRVQGVGFRATVHGIASRHPVVGFVRNLPDGTVELVAEGAGADVEAFLAVVAKQFSGYVTRADVHPIEADESLTRFTIRR
jgi:acylphosphatase